jgi:3'(2'), 5'-bisphosphate nucleotidase
MAGRALARGPRRRLKRRPERWVLGELSCKVPAVSLDDPQQEAQTVCRIAREAGRLAHEYFVAWHGGGKAVQVDLKDADEPVTAADRAVSDFCIAALHREFPADAILSEEIPDDGARRSARRTWLIDPIDGTKDFIAGRPGYSVMIGLLTDAAPTLGVVYQPISDALWWAVRGHGAFQQIGEAAPQRMRVSDVADLASARMVSSASVREPMIAEIRKRAGIRDDFQIGSVGIKLALLGSGERDLYVNPASKTKLWDTAAPEIILHEAGGRLSDLYGRRLRYDGELAHLDGLVASNGRLHDAALAQVAGLIAGRKPTVPDAGS